VAPATAMLIPSFRRSRGQREGHRPGQGSLRRDDV